MMEFPKDHELFKDIRPDGTLETPDIMEKMVRNSAYSAFFNEAQKANDKLPSKTQDKANSVKEYSREIFEVAADAAYQYTKSGYIGMFPTGTFSGAKYGTEENYSQVVFTVMDQLHNYQPKNLCIKDQQQLYSDAVSAKKERRSSLIAVLFLLLNMAIVALAALSLLPGMEQYRLFGRGWDWAVVAAALLTLVLAWIFHLPCNNEWGILGFIHALLIFMSLMWQVEDFESAENIIILTGVTLIVSLISIIHYLADGCVGYVRWRIKDFRKWCDQDALDNYRHLRFLILWYRNLTGEQKTPFDPMLDEFFSTLKKRKNI